MDKARNRPMPNDPETAEVLCLQIHILCNTIASGEAAEDECYRQISKLVARLEAVSLGL